MENSDQEQPISTRKHFRTYGFHSQVRKDYVYFSAKLPLLCMLFPYLSMRSWVDNQSYVCVLQ